MCLISWRDKGKVLITFSKRYKWWRIKLLMAGIKRYRDSWKQSGAIWKNISRVDLFGIGIIKLFILINSCLRILIQIIFLLIYRKITLNHQNHYHSNSNNSCNNKINNSSSSSSSSRRNKINRKVSR
jgi:hypothetical protein